jgi:hypothetical protein
MSKNQNGFDLWVVNNVKPIDSTSSKFRTRYSVYVDTGPAYVADKTKVAQSTNLVAGLGWDSTTRTLLDAKRVSGPYVFLNAFNVEESIIKTAAGGAAAPTTGPLTVLWSIKNVNNTDTPAQHKYDAGSAGGTPAYYNSGHYSLDAFGTETKSGYIEEDYVFAAGSQSYELTELAPFPAQHEFFHFVQHHRLRTNNPGGYHDFTGYYDSALAYNEGMADALPVLVCACSSPQRIYFYAKANQIVNYGDDVANPSSSWPVGWYQETTIARLVWNLLDPAGKFKMKQLDILAPMFSAAELAGRWPMSIWSYAKKLKGTQPSLASAIDVLGGTLNIDFENNDEWGTSETHFGNVAKQDALPIYTNLTVGGSATVCTAGAVADGGKLGTRRYLKTNLTVAGAHAFTMTGPSGTNAWMGYLFGGNYSAAYEDVLGGAGKSSYSKSLYMEAGDTTLVVGECLVANRAGYCTVPSTPPAEQCWSITLQ